MANEQDINSLYGQIAALRDVVGVLLENMQPSALDKHKMLLQLQELNAKQPRYKEQAASGQYHMTMDSFILKLSS